MVSVYRCVTLPFPFLVVGLPTHYINNWTNYIFSFSGAWTYWHVVVIQMNR